MKIYKDFNNDLEPSQNDVSVSELLTRKDSVNQTPRGNRIKIT
jgi:hypothetical protein